jgi:FkbM family methyltransferase
MGFLRSTCRTLRVAWHKPRHWRLRPDTLDHRIFREVALANEYRLPPRFAPDDVVLDVGAHTGAFAHAVLRRGAGRVWCCEADPDNFRLLRHNLAPHGDRARLLHRAVWRSDVRPAALALHNPRRAGNTGGPQVTGRPAGHTVAVLAFDDLVRRATRDGGRVRLLKLDCEGAEWPILLTSSLLGRIDAVCGEYHIEEFPDLFRVAGCGPFTPQLLEQALGDAGFGVVVRPRPGSAAPEVGHFFARRPLGRCFG